MTFPYIPPLTVGQLAEIYAETLSRIYRVKVTISVDDRRGEKHVIEYDHPDIKEQPAEDQARGIPGDDIAFVERLYDGLNRLSLKDFRRILKETIRATEDYADSCYDKYIDNPLDYCLSRSPISQGHALIEHALEIGEETHEPKIIAPSQAAAPDEVG